MLQLRWLWQALIIAFPAAPVTLAQLNLPQGYWADKNAILYISVILLVLGVSSSIISEIAASLQAPAVRRFNDELYKVLLATLISVTLKTESDMFKVGVHAFRISKGPFRRRLINIGSARLGSEPKMVDPRWTRGKGVVGKAWHEGNCVGVRWDRVYKEAQKLGREAWENKAPADRFGLNWQELWLTGGYRIIVAAPIIDAATGTISGCVAIDFPGDAAKLLTPEIQLILRDVTTKLQEIPRPPLVWTGAPTR
ncbi:hypothetical protein OG320_27490 [Microbispora sp. NBC_01189]|uniref:hypothetical protein n=1 Tax=Microbispora sp. NBC_01189 TaxID=2903583 RepID=UPI002E132673|nr:hypothetical protein OG320_27490 [Microbispora sp. NBC_01189]